MATQISTTPQHHTAKGAPLSAPLCAIVNAALALGVEVKALALGVRLVGLDIVLADCWRGLYLCKSSGRGLARVRDDNAGLSLRPADKGQWCVSADTLATDKGAALAQAAMMARFAVNAGYVGFGAIADTLDKASADKADKAPSKADKAPSKADKADKAPSKADKASALDNALSALD